MTGMIQPVVRRIASSTSSDQRDAEDDVPVRSGDVLRSVKSSPPWIR